MSQRLLVGGLTLKCIYRELTATNNEFRISIQKLQLQLLEMCNVSLAKRRDLVLHDLLDKEEDVARSRKEVKLLRAELEHLRNIVHQQINKGLNQVEDDGGRNDGNEDSHHPHETRLRSRPQQQLLQQPSKVYVTDELWRKHGARDSLLPARVSSASADKMRKNPIPESKQGALMSKQEAAQVVLLEVRRLRDSMTKLQKQRDELKAKVSLLPVLVKVCLRLIL